MAGVKIAANGHSFAVGGAIVLRRQWRRLSNVVTKNKNFFKSQIDKCQPEQKLNSFTGDDRRIPSPPAAAKLNVGCSYFSGSYFAAKNLTVLSD